MKKKLSTTQKNQKILSDFSEKKNQDLKEIKEEKKSRKSKSKYRVITRNIVVPKLGKIEQKIECDFDIDLATV